MSVKIFASSFLSANLMLLRTFIEQTANVHKIQMYTVSQKEGHQTHQYLH